MRAFPSYQGQRNFPGLWWAATMGCHVGFESWLERDQVMMLDFDPDVVAFSAQPFWLGWTDADGPHRHAPCEQCATLPLRDKNRPITPQWAPRRSCGVGER